MIPPGSSIRRLTTILEGSPLNHLLLAPVCPTMVYKYKHTKYKFHDLRRIFLALPLVVFLSLERLSALLDLNFVSPLLRSDAFYFSIQTSRLLIDSVCHAPSFHDGLNWKASHCTAKSCPHVNQWKNGVVVEQLEDSPEV